MQIVIEIPKECIPTRQDIMDIQLHFVDRKVVEASGYGFTVLPKHGRLIDTEQAYLDAKKHYFDNDMVMRCIQIAMENAPTILEATEESEE